MSGHTKGPWRATPRPREAVTYIESMAVNGHAGWIANVFGTEGENEANARLIAAAPAMYEALRKVREAILLADDTLLTDTLWVGPAETAADCIDAALAAVDGKEGA